MASTLAGKRVAVTGATGFIGGRLVERLANNGSIVRCLVRDYGSAVRLGRDPAELLKLDLSDKGAVYDALRDVDVVFHCAHDWNSAAANRTATRNLLDAAEAHGLERFVFLSSFVVYDQAVEGTVDEQTGEVEGGGYAGEKLALEREVLRRAREGRLPATVLQPTIVYGPFSKPWTIDPADMMQLGTVVLPSEGRGLCNAVHVDDVVDAMLLAVGKSEAVGERFLISGADALTWRDFYEKLAAGIGAQGPQYWLDEEIQRPSRGLKPKLKKALRIPGKVAARVVRLPVVGKLYTNISSALPESLRRRLGENGSCSRDPHQGPRPCSEPVPGGFLRESVACRDGKGAPPPRISLRRSFFQRRGFGHRLHEMEKR